MSACVRATSAASASSSIPRSEGLAAGVASKVVTAADRNHASARRHLRRMRGGGCRRAPGILRGRRGRRVRALASPVHSLAPPTTREGPRMGLDKTPDLALIEERARALWESTGIYEFDPEAPGEIFAVDTPPPYVSAAHLHVGHAMSLRAGGVHHPVPADAGPEGLLSDGLRRQRAADRALRRADLQDQQGPHDALRVPRAVPGGDGTRRGGVRALLAQARVVGRLAAASTRRSTTTAGAPRRCRSSTCTARSGSTGPRSRCSGTRRCRRRSRKQTSRRSTRNSTLHDIVFRAPMAVISSSRPPGPSSSRAASRSTSIPKTSATPRSWAARDRADQRPRGADPLRRGRPDRLRHRPDDGVHVR